MINQNDPYDVKAAKEKKKRWNKICGCSVVMLVAGGVILPFTMMETPLYGPELGVPSIVAILLGICLICIRIGKNRRYKRTIRNFEMNRINQEKSREQFRNQQIQQEKAFLDAMQTQLNEIHNASLDLQNQKLPEMIKRLRDRNIQLMQQGKSQMLAYMQEMFRDVHEKYMNDKKKEGIKKLRNLFKISKKINLDDISNTLGITRAEFMNMILDNPELMGNFHLEGII